MEPGHAGGGPPTHTAAMIVRQQAEIERLQRRVSDDRFAQDLRPALTKASANGYRSMPEVSATSTREADHVG